LGHAKAKPSGAKKLRAQKLMLENQLEPKQQ